MSAAVARQQQSGHATNSNTGSSRMGTNSPVEKRVAVKTEANNLDKSTRSPTQINNRDRILSPKSSHRRNISETSNPSSSIAVDQPRETAGSTETQTKSEPRPSITHVQPPILPPPPPADIVEKPGDDYFNFHKNRLDQEPNPFEQSFSVGNGDSTPKAILPPASAITSPAPLIGGPSTYGFMSSLRSGPLSPAMLQGPISNGHLGFDTHHIRSGLTPNESGIRSGLTPGGSGSMFPVPSPSSGFLQFGSSTPSTMEFQKTALSAASALRKQHPPPSLTAIPPPLTKPEFSVTAPDAREHNVSAAKPRQLSNAFDADPAHHAANGLYLLAQAHHQNDQYSASNVSAPGNAAVVSTQPNLPSAQDDTSPNSKKRSIVTSTSMTRVGNNTTTMPGNVRGVSEISEDMGSDSDDSDDGKRGGGDGKGAKRAAGRARKSDPKSNKRTKTSQGSANGSGDDQDIDNQVNENGKKMTDEEKRKNFLERNRVAALKCRQRKKQWLQNLQTKVEYYSQENDALSSQVASLREEIVALKTLLLAHKDCPIARATNMGMDTIHTALANGPTDYGNHASFSNMGVMASQPAVHGHPRRYS